MIISSCSQLVLFIFLSIPLQLQAQKHGPLLRGSRDSAPANHERALKKKGKGKKMKGKVKREFFQYFLTAGETADIWTGGPIRVYLDCATNHSSIAMRLELMWDEDILVFGDISFDDGLNDLPIIADTQILPANNLYDQVMWYQGTPDPYEPEYYQDLVAGNKIDYGAVWTSTGHYFAWDGESVIGLADVNTNEAQMKLIGEDTNCIFVGHFEYGTVSTPVKKSKGDE